MRADDAMDVSRGMPRYRLQAGACLFLERLYSGRFRTAVDESPNEACVAPCLRCNDEKGHRWARPGCSALSQQLKSQAAAMPQPCTSEKARHPPGDPNRLFPRTIPKQHY